MSEDKEPVEEPDELPAEGPVAPVDQEAREVIQLARPDPAERRRRVGHALRTRKPTNRLRKLLLGALLVLSLTAIAISLFGIQHASPTLLTPCLITLLGILVFLVIHGIVQPDKLDIDTATGLLKTVLVALTPISALLEGYSHTRARTAAASFACIGLGAGFVWFGPAHVTRYNLFCPPQRTRIQWTAWKGHENAVCTNDSVIMTWRLGDFGAELVDPASADVVGTCSSNDDNLVCRFGTDRIVARRTLLLRTGEQDFARNIEFGFRAAIERIPKAQFKIDTLLAPSVDAATAPGQWEDLGRQVDALLQTSAYDYCRDRVDLSVS